MPPSVFLLPPFFDYGATFLFAASGALIAARRGYDVVGILALALVSATGGGLIRDGLFLQNGPPLLVRNPIYLQLVAGGALTVIVFGRRVQQFKFIRTAVDLVDGLALGAYAVVGMNYALAAGLSPLSSILIGTVNAVGGGVLRSVLMARENEIMKPGTYMAVAVLLGCGVYLAMTLNGWMDGINAAWLTIAVVFFIRVGSVVYDIKTHALPDFQDEWKSTN